MNKKIFIGLAIVLIILIAAAVYLLNPFDSKLKSGLQVIVHDSSASLFLNEQYLDKSPYINNQILPGHYQLKIVPDNKALASYELPITLNQGFLTVVIWKPGETADSSGGVVYELEPLANKKQTEVSIISNPDSALVEFGNYEEQFAPVVIKDLEAGDYEYSIRLVSFETKKDKVRVLAGHRLNVFAKLARTSLAKLADEAQPDLTATASGELNNETEDQTLLLDSNQDRLTINSTNFFQENKEVLRVRQTASLTSEPVGFVTAGKTYAVNQQENNWYLIEFIDALDEQSKQGWVSGDYVTFTPASTESETEEIQEE